VTRIVGGAAGGRRIAVPAGSGTRPTADRVREALFSSLEAEFGGFHGLAILDLYSGSGAIGLEGLSRGAARAVLVEADRKAAEVIAANIKAVGLPGATLLTRPAEKVASGDNPAGPFDLVFADPPYAFGEQQLGVLLETLATPTWLAEHAIVVVERSARGSEPRWPHQIEPIKQKRYGEGVLWYGRRR
jgi:16S rRNA (guanine966-N2)-methyltransferase